MLTIIFNIIYYTNNFRRMGRGCHYFHFMNKNRCWEYLNHKVSQLKDRSSDNPLENNYVLNSKSYLEIVSSDFCLLVEFLGQKKKKAEGGGLFLNSKVFTEFPRGPWI